MDAFRAMLISQAVNMGWSHVYVDGKVVPITIELARAAHDRLAERRMAQA